MDIDKIIAKLNEVNVDNVEPLVSPAELFNVFREDIIKPGLSRADALRNAPEHNNEFFIVPKIIED